MLNFLTIPPSPLLFPASMSPVAAGGVVETGCETVSGISGSGGITPGGPAKYCDVTVPGVRGVNGPGLITFNERRAASASAAHSLCDRTGAGGRTGKSLLGNPLMEFALALGAAGPFSNRGVDGALGTSTIGGCKASLPFLQGPST
jgi:hypothetical protein